MSSRRRSYTCFRNMVCTFCRMAHVLQSAFGGHVSSWGVCIESLHCVPHEAVYKVCEAQGMLCAAHKKTTRKHA